MYVWDILGGISKVPFEIPHKISHTYNERCAFYSDVTILELFDLRAHKCFWKAPWLDRLTSLWIIDIKLPLDSVNIMHEHNL